jgi:chromatin assembly factor 1 subunit A
MARGLLGTSVKLVKAVNRQIQRAEKEAIKRERKRAAEESKAFRARETARKKEIREQENRAKERIKEQKQLEAQSKKLTKLRETEERNAARVQERQNKENLKYQNKIEKENKQREIQRAKGAQRLALSKSQNAYTKRCNDRQELREEIINKEFN